MRTYLQEEDNLRKRSLILHKSKDERIPPGEELVSDQLAVGGRVSDAIPVNNTLGFSYTSAS